MKKETKKKIGSIVLASSILLSSNIVLAKENNYVSGKNIPQTKQEIVVTYNNEKLEFDQPPILEDNRTKVPFRKVFESMGCIVYYNNSENKIMSLTKQGDILTHVIGTKEMELNGEVKTFDSPSTIINDRTLVPLRAVAEALNAEVEWIEKENKVEITKNEEQMDNILKEVMMCVTDDNYNPKDTKRYVEYRKKNPNMDIKQVIMDVNIDLDKELIPVKSYTVIPEYKDIIHYEARDEDKEVVENPDDPLTLLNHFNIFPEDYVCPDIEPFGKRDNGNDPNYYDYLGKNIHEPARALLTRAKEEGLLCNIIVDTPMIPDIDYAWDCAGHYRPYLEIGGETFGYKRFPLGEHDSTRNGYSFVLIGWPGQEELDKELMDRDLLTESDYLVMGPTYLEKLNRMEQTQIWMRENAHNYGFIERYPKNKEQYTRYDLVPNYYTYVGIEVATQMYNEGLCFEEYYAKYLNPTVNDKEYSLEKESAQKVLQKY